MQHFNNVLVIAGADDGSRFWQGLQQVLLEMLRQATSDHNLLSLLCQIHQGSHRFGSGVLDERAGVDHHHLRLGFISAHAVAGFCQQPEHVFGVHPVLLAAQM